jgi:hypothetical protein
MRALMVAHFFYKGKVMFKEFLEDLRIHLLSCVPNLGVELFHRDISQYKYIAQKPVVVMQFLGADLDAPPHQSVLSQKGVLQLNFYYFVRTVDNAHTDGVFELFEGIRSLDGVTIQSIRAYSHRKNVSVWEVKTRVIKAF